MKNLWILLAILLMGVICATQASAVTINSAPAGESNLWTIATNWGFPVSQAQLEAATPLSTLGAGNYTVTFLARYAAHDDDGGFYTVISPVPSHTSTVASFAGKPLVDPDFNLFNSPVDIAFHPSSTFGFYNQDMTTSYAGTTQNQNGAGSQASGFIFDLEKINSAYAGNYLVAFEDGGNRLPFGDSDYNDLAFVVKANAVPLPPSMFLFGSGLLGLAGWRRFRQA